MILVIFMIFMDFHDFSDFHDFHGFRTTTPKSEVSGLDRYLAVPVLYRAIYSPIPPYTLWDPEIRRLEDLGHYISRARMRPRVNACARIMRARGRAHAPARGDKQGIYSRTKDKVLNPMVGNREIRRTLLGQW